MSPLSTLTFAQLSFKFSMTVADDILESYSNEILEFKIKNTHNYEPEGKSRNILIIK